MNFGYLRKSKCRLNNDLLKNQGEEKNQSFLIDEGEEKIQAPLPDPMWRVVSALELAPLRVLGGCHLTGERILLGCRRLALGEPEGLSGALLGSQGDVSIFGFLNCAKLRMNQGCYNFRGLIYYC